MNVEKKFLGFAGYKFDRYDNISNMVSKLEQYNKIEKFFIARCLDVCDGDGITFGNIVYAHKIDEKLIEKGIIESENEDAYDGDIYFRQFTRYRPDGICDFVYDFYGYPGDNQSGFIIFGFVDLIGNAIITAIYTNSDCNIDYYHSIKPIDKQGNRLVTKLYSMIRAEDDLAELIGVLVRVKIPWSIIGIVVLYSDVDAADSPDDIKKFFA